MMAEAFIVRTNLPEFIREVKAFGDRFEKSIATDGLRAAGAVFRDTAQFLAPVLGKVRRHSRATGRLRNVVDPRRVRGALKRSIFLGRSRFGGRGLVAYYVGVRASRTVGKGRNRKTIDPFYWRFLEGGWVPRGPGRRLGGRRRRALERAREAAAGPVRKHQFPFLRPAFERVKGPALNAFTAKVEIGLKAEQAKR